MKDIIQIMYYLIFIINYGINSFHFQKGNGDWGLGIGDSAQSPIPNPQSPIPNPQSPNYKPLCSFIQKSKMFIYMKYKCY